MPESTPRPLAGKTALVTGAAAGIGRITALALARQGAHVLVAARGEPRAQPVVNEITGTGGSAAPLAVDLASLTSVRAAANRVLEDNPRLHILVNNAGIWAGSRSVTTDGIELTFAVNTLAPFLFTNLLLSALKEAGKARVVNVSSREHYGGKINWDDIQHKNNYGARRAYQQSKLALTMLTHELAKRVEGTGLTANSLHPGVIATDLFRNMPGFVQFFIRLLMRSPEDGAAPQIKLATDPAFDGVTGRYFNRFSEARPHVLALNEAARKRLWQLCEDLVGA